MIEGLSSKTPKVFISYSWDSPTHRNWVRSLATRLCGDGVDAILDQWEAQPGDDLPKFMEQAVRESDFVLCICTPRYKAKCDDRSGGVGYEGGIMTGEAFVYQNQRKFIPVLRAGDWGTSSPSWMLGKYQIDLRDDPYNEENYRDLMRTLFHRRPGKPVIGEAWQDPIVPGGVLPMTQDDDAKFELSNTSDEDFEFVNREIELGTLSPQKLREAYWQWALISAPTGYGKTRLLGRLIDEIKKDTKAQQAAQTPERDWNYCSIYIDLKPKLMSVVGYIFKKICDREQTAADTDEWVASEICNYIQNNMSGLVGNGPKRNVLIIFDSIEKLTRTDREWLWGVLHEAIIGSYIDYEENEAPFQIRFLLSGTNVESFVDDYKRWEKSEGCKPKLISPQKLPLSPFEKNHVEQLISKRAGKRGINIKKSVVSDLAESLLFFSGGHPLIINGILDELVRLGFLNYEKYLKQNRHGLVRKYIAGVARNILRPFRTDQEKKDIKTICVFRMMDIPTSAKLQSIGLIGLQADIDLLRLLCAHKILKDPTREKPYYHDDIIRRILYLDLVFGSDEDRVHVQKTHSCAHELYRELIDTCRDPYSPIQSFLVEWLFHALQLEDLDNKTIREEWKFMYDNIPPLAMSAEEVRGMVRTALDCDGEVKYWYRERFDTDDFSELLG